jgi:serine/threonine-protein kinase
MKRVRGDTLEAILHRLRTGDPEHTERYTTHRLLTAFAQACLAVDFAHKRSVVHRDLKPANLMLGDHGEVYVLDWGLAKVTGGSGVFQRPELADPTQPGRPVGTLGYMAPEQVVAQRENIDGRVDVYALGAILFEILTLSTLHPRGSSRALIESTLKGADARATVRAPDRTIPPELDAACVRATARREERSASARDLYDAVEAVLSGQRDQALRQRLAAEHAETARRVASEALSGASEAHAARIHALRSAGRALALDPRQSTATQAVVELLARPPKDAPPGARVDAAAARRVRRALGNVGLIGYLACFAFAPLVFWAGVVSWPPIFTIWGLMGVATVGYVMLHRASAPAAWMELSVLALATAGIASMGTVISPDVIVPAFIAVNTAGFTVSAERAPRWAVIAIGALGVVLGPALEWIGVLSPSYAFTAEQLSLIPRAMAYAETPTRLILVLANAAIVVMGAVYVGLIRDAVTRAERKAQVMSWQLRSLVGEQPEE